MQGRSIFRGIRSTACFWESNPFHSIPLSQWHSSRARRKPKKCADFCEVGPKEGAIEQFFDLGLAADLGLAGFTCPVHPFLASSAKLDIVKVPKTQIWDKLGAIWLFNSNEPQTIIIENSCDNYTHRAFWQSTTHTSYTVAQAIKISEASNCRTSYSFVQLHAPGRQLLEFLRGSCAYTIVLFFEHEIHLSYKLKRKQALLSIWGK